MGYRHRFQELFERTEDGWCYKTTRTVTYEGRIYPKGIKVTETALAGLFGRHGYRDVEVTGEVGTDIYHIMGPWLGDDTETETETETKETEKVRGNTLWDHLTDKKE